MAGRNPVKWREFQAGLDDDFRKLTDEYGKLRKDMIIQAAEVAESLVPRRSGRLANSISASKGSPRKSAKGGSPQVRRTVERLEPFESLFLMANDFKASWFETGTVKMRARPFFRVALQSVANMKR